MNRKITYYIVIGLLLFTSNLQAQEYHPFPTKNTIWSESFHPGGGYYPNKYHYFALKDNDTIIKGNEYHKLYFSYDTTFTEENICGAIREENKRVYYYSINSLSCVNTPMPTDTEIVLYDFNLQIGDTITDEEFRVRYPGELILMKTDSLLVGPEYMKVYKFGHPIDSIDYIIEQAQWIEGVGCIRGLMADMGYMPTGSFSYSNLNCFIQNGEVPYHSEEHPECYNKNPSTSKALSTNSRIRIAPNPVNSSTKIEFENLDYKSLIISDRSGKKLKEYDLKGKSFLVINKEELSNGLYLISVYDNAGNVQTLKLLFE